MNDTKTTGDKTISVERKKTLTIKRSVEQGTVRQSFSHGRSKSVVVEKKKRRIVLPGAAEESTETPSDAAEPALQSGDDAQAGAAVRTLTDSEMDARAGWRGGGV